MSPARRFRIALLLGLLAAMRADRAVGDLIVADDFESYSQSSINGQSGGTNGTGAWGGAYSANAAITVVGGGLTYNSGAISINGGSQSAAIGFTGGALVDPALSRAFTGQTGTLYYSMLFRPVAGLDNSDFLQFFLNDDPDQNNALSFGVRNSGSGDTGFFARIIGPSDVKTQTGVKAVQDTTYLLVGKVSVGGSGNYDHIDVYLNPSTLTEPVAASASVTNNSGTSLIDHFTFRTSGLESGDQFNFDVLRIGTTYADVVGPYGVTAIPEPSSLALATLGAGAFAARRRRRAVRLLSGVALTARALVGRG